MNFKSPGGQSQTFVWSCDSEGGFTASCLVEELKERGQCSPFQQKGRQHGTCFSNDTMCLPGDKTTIEPKKSKERKRRTALVQ